MTKKNLEINRAYDAKEHSSNLWTAQYIDFLVTGLPFFSKQCNWKFNTQVTLSLKLSLQTWLKIHTDDPLKSLGILQEKRVYINLFKLLKILNVKHQYRLKFIHK